MSLTAEEATAFFMNQPITFISDILVGYSRPKIDLILTYLSANETSLKTLYGEHNYIRVLDTVQVARFGRLP